MNMPITYAIYLLISAAVTIWVARTLHSRGRIFLVETFHGNEKLADAVNALLVVGFYLVNFGYVTLALRFGTKPHDLQEAIEFLATKVGLVLLILGAMHFFNLYVFHRIRKQKEKPPVRANNPFRPTYGELNRTAKSERPYFIQ